MTEETLTLALHGDVSVDEFADALVRWRGIVDAITKYVAPGGGLEWFISDLAAGSATVTASGIGVPEVTTRAREQYIQVGAALAGGQVDALPAWVRDDALALTGVIGGHVDYIRFETAELDKIITSNYSEASAAVAPPRALEVVPALGGVEGRVQTVTSRGALRFTLFDTLYDKAVSCYLKEGQEDIMRDVWGYDAVVEGVVTRDPVTGRPLAVRSVRNVTRIRRVPPDAYVLARGAVPVDRADERPPEQLIDHARADA